MKRVIKAASSLFIALFLFAMAATEVAASPSAFGPTGPTGAVDPNAPPTTPSAIPSSSNFGSSGSILEPPGGGVLDGAYTPEHLPFRKPIPYVYEREADIMWQRRIWRVIDLREKINHPLYYPDDTTSKRPALFWVIKRGIAAGKINTVFEFDAFTNEFGRLMTQQEAMSAMMDKIAMKDSIGQPIMDSTGNQVMVPTPLKPENIAQYYMKEDWFFEKQRSVMDVRIIALAPVVEVDDPVQGKFGYRVLFWLYYPALRNYLSQFYCYNPYNDAEWRTYDEIFHKRLFNSYTRMESNVYNRPIAAYLSGQSMEQLLEAERIKDDIFKIEHDMWNF
jgi:gliding motility associated protien GldN